MDSRSGRGWSLICQPANEDIEDEPFLISDMVVELIADTDQEENVEILRNDKVDSGEPGASA